jgi:CBS-domain-containing membrane protein
MKPVWLRAVAAAIRRNDHRNVMAGAVAGLGAAIAIGVMEWVALAAHYPLVIIPFATSIVLVIGSPEAEPAQPRALIGGHVVATLVGLAMLRLTGPHAWAAAVAVGLAGWQCISPARFIRLRGSIHCWWFPIACPGRSCWPRCWRVRCC